MTKTKSGVLAKNGETNKRNAFLTHKKCKIQQRKQKENIQCLELEKELGVDDAEKASSFIACAHCRNKDAEV